MIVINDEEDTIHQGKRFVFINTPVVKKKPDICCGPNAFFENYTEHLLLRM